MQCMTDVVLKVVAAVHRRPMQCCQCGNNIVLQNITEVSHAMHDKRAVGRVGAAVEERPTDTNREGPASLISILLPS